MAEITWVNHSSFVVGEGQTRLICDPWIEGSIFNNGWDLLAPTRWTYDDFRGLTHMWFSHEHPDHFFPPNLQKIPQEIRGQLEVLYQPTKDHKVLNYCRKLGFLTRELRPFEWTDLGGSMRVKCGPFPTYDSWLLFDVSGFKILNLNDCQVRNTEMARKLLEKTGPVDVLLSQFSYACWVGNPDNLEARRRAGQRALSHVSHQMEVIRPRYFIPSASFVLFSHEENNYLNDSINRVDFVSKFLSETTNSTIVPMYPGDRWVVGEEHDGSNALRKYTEDYEGGVKNRHKTAPVSWNELEEISRQHVSRMGSRNGRFWMRVAAMRPLRLLGAATAFVTDYDQVFRFDVFQGLRPAPEVKRSEADMEMSSGTLAYTLKYDWGFDTLYVNACFRASREGFLRFERSLSLSLLNNTGRSLGPLLVLDPAFCRKAVTHFFPKVGKLLG
jgi:UDP-MurNAc hydroxylase